MTRSYISHLRPQLHRVHALQGSSPNANDRLLKSLSTTPCRYFTYSSLASLQFLKKCLLKYIYIILKCLLKFFTYRERCRHVDMPINAKTIFEDERKLTQRRNKLRQILVNQNKLTVAILKKISLQIFFSLFVYYGRLLAHF